MKTLAARAYFLINSLKMSSMIEVKKKKKREGK